MNAEQAHYEVFASDGQRVLHAPESCRYPRHIELDMLEAGYSIRLHGRRITKTELRKKEEPWKKTR